MEDKRGPLMILLIFGITLALWVALEVLRWWVGYYLSYRVG